MLGYSGRYIIQNFGMLCWTIFFAPIGYVLALFIISFFTMCDFDHLKPQFNRLLFYNYWIGWVNEMYFFLAMCVGLNIMYLRWGSYGDVINSLLAVFFGFILSAFPFFMAIFYTIKKIYAQILPPNEEFIARYGSPLEGLNFKRRGKLVLIYTCASLIRKLSLAYILLFWQEKPVFSIFAVTFQALIMITI